RVRDLDAARQRRSSGPWWHPRAGRQTQEGAALEDLAHLRDQTLVSRPGRRQVIEERARLDDSTCAVGLRLPVDEVPRQGDLAGVCPGAGKLDEGRPVHPVLEVPEHQLGDGLRRLLFRQTLDDALKPWADRLHHVDVPDLEGFTFPRHRYAR